MLRGTYFTFTLTVNCQENDLCKEEDTGSTDKVNGCLTPPPPAGEHWGAGGLQEGWKPARAR